VSFFDKIKNVTYVNCVNLFLQRGSNNIFRASIIKISTLNKDVLESEWALTSRALRLIYTWQQIRMCASRTYICLAMFLLLFLSRCHCVLSLLTIVSFWRDRDDFCWWPPTVGPIACILFPVQLFQNAAISHRSAVSFTIPTLSAVHRARRSGCAYQLLFRLCNCSSSNSNSSRSSCCVHALSVVSRTTNAVSDIAIERQRVG